MIWFTADSHFFHSKMWKEFEPQTRPFKSTEEMNDELIARWNAVIKPTDTVYHLGDFACIWYSSKAVYMFEELCKKLQGHKYIIPGNHDDKRLLLEQTKVKVLPAQFVLCWNKQHFILSHFPMLTWDRSHYGTFQLFGHHHGHLQTKWRQMDVGVDAHNLTPISIEQVYKTLINRPIFRGQNKESKNEIAGC